jgi:pimeloyl-ACP methyl ester carboxylesterase
VKVLPGAGHACQMEQPWLFDCFMIEFLTKHGLFPGASKPTG